MRLSRRDFLKAAAVAVAAGRLAPSVLAELVARVNGRTAPRVIWLQGSGCDGCAISFLNSIHYASVEDLLTGTLDVRFQSNIMAATGDLAVSAAEAAGAEPGYVLIVEGAIPTGAGGKFCKLWPGMSMHQGVLTFAAGAGYIVALGACASFGGVTRGAPNPTGAQGVSGIIGSDPRLVNLPGCPAHPDWLIGTISYILANGALPPLDAHRRPLEFYGKRVHDNCFRRHKLCGEPVLASQLGEDTGCLEFLGCKGKHTYSDCPLRKWNSSGPNRYGVNWCIGANSPCLGCVQPTFPDGMSPFYEYLPADGGRAAAEGQVRRRRNRRGRKSAP